MNKDPAVLFKVVDFKERIKLDKLITPEKIKLMLSCCNCQGEFGESTESICIENELYNLCSECSQYVCVYCSPTNNFKNSNFICSRRH